MSVCIKIRDGSWPDAWLDLGEVKDLLEEHKKERLKKKEEEEKRKRKIRRMLSLEAMVKDIEQFKKTYEKGEKLWKTRN